MSDFILDGRWIIPDFVLLKSSSLAAEIGQYVIPTVPFPDEQIWCASDSGSLTLKSAYELLSHTGSHVP